VHFHKSKDILVAKLEIGEGGGEFGRKETDMYLSRVFRLVAGQIVYRIERLALLHLYLASCTQSRSELA